MAVNDLTNFLSVPKNVHPTKIDSVKRTKKNYLLNNPWLFGVDPRQRRLVAGLCRLSNRKYKRIDYDGVVCSISSMGSSIEAENRRCKKDTAVKDSLTMSHSFREGNQCPVVENH